MALSQFATGFRLFTGESLNAIVNLLNNITGGGTAAAVTANPLTVTGNATFSGGSYKEIPVTVAAAGATQGTATAIPVTCTVVKVTVTASTEGLKLPTAATGLQVTVLADPAVGAKIYTAAAGQVIGANTTATTAFLLVKNTATTFFAIDTTHWRVAKGS